MSQPLVHSEPRRPNHFEERCAMNGARMSTLASLRGSIERIEAPGDVHGLNKVALGHRGADAMLRGGLALAAVHEVFAEGHQGAAASASPPRSMASAPLWPSATLFSPCTSPGASMRSMLPRRDASVLMRAPFIAHRSSKWLGRRGSE